MEQTQFEKACATLGIDPNLMPGVQGLPEITATQIIAFYKLDIIERAANIEDDFEPDFNNYKQEKRTPWLLWSPAVSAFVCNGTDCTFTTTGLGARFWFKTAKRSKQFFKQNSELINDFHRRK